MTDYAMCLGEGCIDKKECYRYTAKPDGLRQRWMTAVPTSDGYACDYFIDNRTKYDPQRRETND